MQTRENASNAKLAHLRETLATHDEALDEWLGGAKSAGLIWTGDYIAFSLMSTAANGRRSAPDGHNQPLAGSGQPGRIPHFLRTH